MENTIENLDIEKGQKDNKTEILKRNIRLAESKVIEEMHKLALNKISTKREGDRIMDRLNFSLNKLKYIKKH